MKVEAPCGCVFDLTDKTIREQRWHCPTCNEFLDEGEEPVRIYECSHDDCGTKYSEEDGSSKCCPGCNRPFNRKLNDCGHASCADEEECEKVTAVQCPVCEEWCCETDLTKGVDAPVTTKAGRKQKQQQAASDAKAEQAAQLIEVKRRLGLFVDEYHVKITRQPLAGSWPSATARCYAVSVSSGNYGSYPLKTWTLEEADRAVVIFRETANERHRDDFRVEVREEDASLGLHNLPEYSDKPKES